MEINKVHVINRHAFLLTIIWDKKNQPNCYWSVHEKGDLTEEQCKGMMIKDAKGQTTHFHTPFDQAHFREVQALIRQNAARPKQEENY